jgi:hypothetical protein
MVSRVSIIVAVLLLVMAGNCCLAFPPSPPPDPAPQTFDLTSTYKDGYKANGQVYTDYYDVGTDKFYPLDPQKKDLATVKTELRYNMIALVGRDADGVQVQYMGNGSNLTEDTFYMNWKGGYTLKFYDDSLVTEVHAHLDFSGSGMTPAEQQTYMYNVKVNAEASLNNKYYLRRTTASDGSVESLTPLAFEIDLGGPYNYTVAIKSGKGREDALDWYDTTNANTQLHEILHWFGNYDEYWAGFLAPAPNQVLDESGVMGSGTKLKPGYFTYLLPWAHDLDDRSDVVMMDIAAVPEPCAMIALLCGLAGLSLLRRRGG